MPLVTGANVSHPMTKPFKAGAPVDAWTTAVELLVRWLENNERVDTLLDSLPRGRPVAAQGVLFTKIEDAQVAEWSERFGGAEV